MSKDTKNKKKMLIIVPSLALGGQERVAMNTAEIMKNDYDVTMVVFDSENMFYHPSCHVVGLDIPSSSNNVMRVINAIRRAYKIYKIKREFGIYVTISFGLTANLANVLFGSYGKAIVSIHSYGSLSINMVSRHISLMADKIICCSHKLKHEMVKLFSQHQSKIVCIPNVYDIEKMEKEGKEKVEDYQFAECTIVSHGRLEEVKNYPRLIRSFFVVKKNINDAKLLIIGDGLQRQDLEKLILKLDLSDSVTLLGLRDNPFAYLEKSTIYVLSSLLEGFPNSLIEGMTFLPVIAVDCMTGPREILSDGSLDAVADNIEEADYGILVKPAKECSLDPTITQDDQILAEAILSVLINPDKSAKLKLLAHKRVGEYSVEAYRNNLLKVLGE